MTREELRKGLIPGDQLKIAKMFPGKLKHNMIYVCQVLHGETKASRGKAKRILELAAIIIEHNKQLDKLINPPKADYK